MRFRLWTRRWYRPSPTCQRHIFAERLPGIVAPSARRTCRLAEVVEAIAFALGGQAGARLLVTLGMPLSADTLLDTIRATVIATEVTPHVSGIDDWAWRRGHR